VNRPIVRLAALVALLFGLLVAFTSRWTVFEAASLRDSSLNHRSELAKERVARGEIVAADGAVLARSVRSGEGTYERRYPTGPLFAGAVGYSFVGQGSTGIEGYRDEALEGQLGGGLQRLLNQLQGISPGGDTVHTTLIPSAQRVAMSALAGREGAVVALDPRTGAVKVMASSPSFDPNRMRESSSAKRLGSAPGAPLVNRALQYGYAPGSTFKVLTASAALDTGAFTPQSTVSGRNGILVSGVPLNNDKNETYGEITLTKALALSVNTVYAQVAQRLGRATMERYMRRFGFDAKPKLDYPQTEMSASGEYFGGERLTAPSSEQVDLGRLGIGQDRLRVTPLQMAQVAAAVANHGTLMVPHLTSRIVDPEGRTVTNVRPHVQSQVMSPRTAAEVTSMMEAVVNEGTGTTAQIPGIQVAGKTGTAETVLSQSTNNAWFIAFAPAAKPTVAVAVTVAKVPGYGATYAAPIAKQVIEALLR
jgi:peptidoglycan glycosyltransferase